MKNLYNGFSAAKDQQTLYASIKGADQDVDYKITKHSNGKFEVTEITSGKSQTFDAKDFDLEYGALLRFNLNGSK